MALFTVERTLTGWLPFLPLFLFQPPVTLRRFSISICTVGYSISLILPTAFDREIAAECQARPTSNCHGAEPQRT